MRFFRQIFYAKSNEILCVVLEGNFGKARETDVSSPLYMLTLWLFPIPFICHDTYVLEVPLGLVPGDADTIG